ncbi:MAG TPA: 50S ribosomal protein L3 [Tepidisphaeraceae bacterium]|jgi:large subunit ribosomal protein L3|nr:50S ribosomal protein L3 [Tepidisphaeraceae bacterium]
MTPAVLGKKVGMTRIYDEKGAIVPVTVVQVEPNAITQVKTVETDGYNAVQLGFGEIKPKYSTFPLIGHAAKSGSAPRKHFREINLKGTPTDKALGDLVTVEIFDGVQFVDVIGTSKGKGTAGVMKRHHFGGQPASHGTERKHRSPGSLASRATWRGQSGKPKKGVRMAGHMGMDQVTTRNHPLVKVDTANNLLLIKGSLPGPNGTVLFVRKSITAKVKAAE